MKLKPLSEPAHPDFSDQVIHFTGRAGAHVEEVDEAILSMSARERMYHILCDRKLRAFTQFGLPWRDRVVCFTECTRAGVMSLLASNRYTPLGLAFTKDFIMGQGGGPAFYVRGDDWPLVRSMPSRLRARATRFWPGATPEPGESLEWYESGQCEFTREREWRIVGDTEFAWADVAFVMMGSRADFAWLKHELETATSCEFNIPEVIVRAGLSRVPIVEHDPHNIWCQAQRVSSAG